MMKIKNKAILLSQNSPDCRQTQFTHISSERSESRNLTRSLHAFVSLT